MTFRPDHRDPNRGPTRFFWAWLTIATTASVAGNVAHAILNAPRETATLAAATSVVPPLVLLGSTHSVALLVRTGQPSLVYRCALVTTILLAGCAFALSFDALSGLAAMAGMRSEHAWLWPCAIDVSIAQSTLALLALTGSARGQASTEAVPGPAEHPSPGATTAAPTATRHVPEPTSPTDAAERESPERTAAVARWRTDARRIVDAGVTQKDVAVVALVLADHAAGVAPSTISRRADVHHSTVRRILDGQAKLS